MRAAGRLAAETLDMIAPHVRPGVTTGALDVLCHEFITAHGAVPAPLNYRGYPKSICTSINHVVCHGIPGDRKLEPGDVLNIDVTVILDGWHGDSSRMYAAGMPSTRARNLIDVTYEAMLRGVRAVKPGVTLGDVGYAIQKLRRGPPLLRGARLLRPRHRPALPRTAQRAAFRPPRRGPGAAARHVLHHRADGERRPPRGEGAGRRLDRGHPRPQPVRPVRAHDRGDRTGVEIFTLSPARLDKPPYHAA